jgi:hypothetical protein
MGSLEPLSHITSGIANVTVNTWWPRVRLASYKPDPSVLKLLLRSQELSGTATVEQVREIKAHVKRQVKRRVEDLVRVLRRT